MSLVQFKESELKSLGKLIVAVFSMFGMLYKREFVKDDEKYAFLKIFSLKFQSICKKRIRLFTSSRSDFKKFD